MPLKRASLMAFVVSIERTSLRQRRMIERLTWALKTGSRSNRALGTKVPGEKVRLLGRHELGEERQGLLLRGLDGPLAPERAPELVDGAEVRRVAVLFLLEPGQVVEPELQGAPNLLLLALREGDVAGAPLDGGAGLEHERGAAYRDTVAFAKEFLLDALLVHVGAVAAAEVADEAHLADAEHLRVVAAGALSHDLDSAVGLAAEGQRGVAYLEDHPPVRAVAHTYSGHRTIPSN